MTALAAQSQNAVSYENTRLADYTYDDSIERGGVDIPFTMLALLLLTIGVVMVLSSSYARAYYDLEGVTGGNATYYFVRQALFALCGVGVMFVCSRLPMGFYRRMSGFVMAGAVGLLVVVLVLGAVGGGARRWINLGFTTFQPSELAKIGVILYFSVLICRTKEKMRTFRYGILPFAAILGAVCVLLALEPHWSAIIIIVALGLVMLFVGGVRLGWFIGGGLGVGSLLAIAYAAFPYVRDRISAWLDPFADASDSGWQVIQSLYSIGSGGLLGLGLGNSRQKYLYLPEEHNDYIFSIVCEELGFIGAMLILALFALLIIRGYWLALHARDKYSCLVGVGITTLLALQVILNVPSAPTAFPARAYLCRCSAMEARRCCCRWRRSASSCPFRGTYRRNNNNRKRSYEHTVYLRRDRRTYQSRPGRGGPHPGAVSRCGDPFRRGRGPHGDGAGAPGGLQAGDHKHRGLPAQPEAEDASQERQNALAHDRDLRQNQAYPAGIQT